MKTGIISMQRVINYGSFLQAYALKSMIESFGNSVAFVDIKKGRQVVPHLTNKRQFGVDRYILKRVEHVVFKKNRQKLFRETFFSAIGINTPVEESECDNIVIGSDEVFNCCQPSEWGFSSQLFGNTEVPSVTYAASCGYSNYPHIEALGLNDEIRDALGRMKAISVRDNNTYQFVKQLTGAAPLQHLDPVLVYDWKKEIWPQERFKNYILIYAYDNRINNEDEIRAIKAFAKKHNKKLISFGVYQRWCDRNVICNPFELLSYFDGADYVITDTFHGTVISIKRNKQFVTIVRDSNKNKLSDLLSKFGLIDREITAMEELESIITTSIDYIPVNRIISVESKRSLDYLRENLS